MNLRTRLAKLEAARPAPSAPWLHCIVDTAVETLEDVIARDFGGVTPENLIAVHLVSPGMADR